MNRPTEYCNGADRTKAYIDLNALDHNLWEVRAKAGGRRVMGVVKADAYGHGAVEVAKRLVSGGVDMLGVALVEEAARLREADIWTPTLVLRGVLEHQAEDLVKYKITPTVYAMAQAEAFSESAVSHGLKLPVHVKVDTGMGRVGMQPDEVVEFITGLQTPGLRSGPYDAPGRRGGRTSPSRSTRFGSSTGYWNSLPPWI
jgi:alanine racemase